VVTQPFQRYTLTDILQHIGENFILLSTFLSHTSLSANVKRAIAQAFEIPLHRTRDFSRGEELKYLLGLVHDNFQLILIHGNILKWRADRGQDQKGTDPALIMTTEIGNKNTSALLFILLRFYIQH
jgi:hypothetical protein